jgi:outer membrane protein OmpA-like peptidoglycan-associated protein
MRRLAAALLLAAAPLAGAADADPRTAYFGSSSPSLTGDTYLLLRELAAEMQADPRMSVEVEGHSDMSGPAVKNLPLSQQRADAARDFLLSLGIAPERVVAKGYGESRPVNDNKTLERRAWNRRVQFRRLDATP